MFITPIPTNNNVVRYDYKSIRPYPMIKRLLFLLILLNSLNNFGQCDEENNSTVLLIGDSWAFFMHADQTFNKVMSNWGHSNQQYFSNSELAVNGARTEDFLTVEKLDEIEEQLLNKPELKAVHISLGGNDFLGAWNIDFTEEELENLMDETFEEVETIVDFIHAVRSDVQIVFSGYMYANFEEIINDAAPFEESHPFYDTWADMGFPTFEELNGLLNSFSTRMLVYSTGLDYVDFVYAPGYMQYIFGQEEPLGVAPGGTYPKLYQPLPDGDITYPSPKISMRNYGFFIDCFHLSVSGYEYMIDYQFENLYHKLLMDDSYFLSDELSEGSVSSSGVVRDDLIMGNFLSDDYVTLISFNTTELPDTNIQSASLFVRLDSVNGEFTIDDDIEVTIKIGNFGIDEEVDPDDFEDSGDYSSLACVFNASLDSANWLRIDLNESFLPLIETSDIIQFKLDANLGADNFIRFTGSENPKFSPVFNVNYVQPDLSSKSENLSNLEGLKIFPNPVNDVLYLKNHDQESSNVMICDINGKCQEIKIDYNNKLNVSNLSPGWYILKVVADGKIYHAKFIKK